MEKIIRVEVIKDGRTTAFTMTAGESLRDSLPGISDTKDSEADCSKTEMSDGVGPKEHHLESSLRVSMPCGGLGICGKCKVRFAFGAPIPTPGEKKQLTPHEIDAGVRLFCRCRPTQDCAVEIGYGADEREMAAETADVSGDDATADSSGCHYGIAIDLGTTTIAAALVEVCGNKSRIAASASCVNSQRKYGADVISRIAAATGSKETGSDLRNLVRNDIENLMMKLTHNVHNITGNRTAADLGIVIAGNTTMLHLLTGKDVSGLGVYPYTPVSLEQESIRWGKEPSDDAGEGKAFPFGRNLLQNAEVTLLPGISAFVGADIVSGLYYIDGNSSQTSLFIDLGTNGEMALLDRGRIKATSTAAGPVFEAGGISCGVASVPGAIAHVDIVKNGEKSESRSTYYYDIKSSPGTFRVRVSTIENQPPIGLCGTGVMELVSELVRCGIVDETGLLAEEFFDRGFPVTEDGKVWLTQNDIRNVQMGKAAIASGIRTLLRKSPDPPEVVYIAGGFGSHIDTEKIHYLKMLPPEFEGRTVAVGNASLKGAIRYIEKQLSGEDSEENPGDPRNDLERIARCAEVIELAATDSFDEDYIESMNF
ncbi:ASKHA domain-containing protein [Butyrivibrio sp. FCS014]|uniref:ASKHA domain-containing protein n=1 Tax=Butyrivibrio sp. FCS014 TaxID=1408304 RepID=UPI000464E99A|nr:ASKHA domain-containing protein [Butyrivibrio sp. FCS014]